MKIKSQFDSHEYERIAYSVGEEVSGDKDIASLEILATHFVLQKKSMSSTSSTSSVVNGKARQGKQAMDYLAGEKTRLLKLCECALERFSSDSILTYLRAVVLGTHATPSDSRFVAELLVRSIKLNKWNWAAWLELAQLDEAAAAAEEELSHFELFHFFKLEQLRALKKFPQLLRELAILKVRDWSYLDEMEGLSFHEIRDFPRAVECFERIKRKDRFHIGGMDVLSNCLFVLERADALSELAHHWMETNPNAPETNVILGNFFSLKSDHEKAALFFKRATTLCPSNINAWLLLGHELIELRNPSAALAAYQQAARCPGGMCDMRPWYAMGQLFELINQFAFAAYYHNRAVQIDPRDARVWKALSCCYLRLNRPDESNQCAKRAQAAV